MSSITLSLLHELLPSNRQELCAEAPRVPSEELGEDEGEAGAAEEGGREGAGRRQPVHLHPVGRSHQRRRQHQVR